MKKIDKNILALICFILFFVITFLIATTITKIERNYCENNGGKFILGYRESNKCIYE